jgi:hypothetical protein
MIPGCHPSVPLPLIGQGAATTAVLTVGTLLVPAVVVVMVVIVVIVAVVVVAVAEEELVVVLAGGTAAMTRVTETVMVILVQVPVTSMHFTLRWRSVVRRLHEKRTKLIWVNRPQVW